MVAILSLMEGSSTLPRNCPEPYEASTLPRKEGGAAPETLVDKRDDAEAVWLPWGERIKVERKGQGAETGITT